MALALTSQVLVITGGSVPTQGETYAKLMENLRHAQENSAMLAHLANEICIDFVQHYLAAVLEIRRAMQPNDRLARTPDLAQLYGPAVYCKPKSAMEG